MASHTRVIWVYNMPSEEKKRIKLRSRRTPLRLLEKLKTTIKELYSVNPEYYIPPSTRLTCIDEFCIIHSEVSSTQELRTSGLRVIFEGTWLGVYTRGLILPSILIARRIFRDQGVQAAILVAERGVKAFLYGNDILPESVIKIYPPSRGIYAVIDGVDNEIVGFTRWSSEKRVYVNLYDLGIFLRLLG